MKKRILLLLTLVSSWAVLSAQQFSHVVYLKNGWVIHGKVLHNNRDSLKIESYCNDIFIFNTADVLRIEDEKIKPAKKMTDSLVNFQKKGLYSLSTIGLVVGKSDVMDGPGYSLKTQIGYQFSNYAGIGLGVGIEKLNIEIIPVFISFRSELMKRENTPTLNLYLGYSFPLDEEKTSDYANLSYEGGICVGFDIGICSYKTTSRAFILSAGYQYQHITEKSIYSSWYSNTIETNTYDFNKIVIKIGFLFK